MTALCIVMPKHTFSFKEAHPLSHRPSHIDYKNNFECAFNRHVLSCPVHLGLKSVPSRHVPSCPVRRRPTVLPSATRRQANARRLTTQSWAQTTPASCCTLPGTLKPMSLRRLPQTACICTASNVCARARQMLVIDTGSTGKFAGMVLVTHTNLPFLCVVLRCVAGRQGQK